MVQASNPRKYTLEICSNSVQSALNAQIAGAHRVELCDNLWESGTTPSYAAIKKARELLNIELYVLIRPRGGDFVYSDLEFDLICEDIIASRAIGVDGIVSGVLNPDNTIDTRRTRELIEHARPLPFTFHRAFDVTPDLLDSLSTLIELKADRVLTSGGQKSAPDVPSVIARLVGAAKSKITILPGGGIDADNIFRLLPSGCTEFHLTGNSEVVSPAIPNDLALNGAADIPETNYYESSIENIKGILSQLNAHFQ